MFQLRRFEKRRRSDVVAAVVEVCESRYYCSAVTLPLSGIIEWGALDQSRSASAKLREIDSRDYRFSAVAGQHLAFDLDPKKSGFAGGIQILDAESEIVVENTGGVAPRETAGEGYLEWRVPTDGTYIVRISSPVGGKFKLEATPLNVISDEEASGGSTVTGAVAMPNPGKHLTSSAISLTRVQESSLSDVVPIEEGVRTWVVIHGRVDSSDSFLSLARTVAEQTGDQVLLLDWSSAAADNVKPGKKSTTPNEFNGALTGAEWIPSVGTWLAEALARKGIAADQTFLVGHSWGSYVAYETAEELEGTKGIVALDPARTGTGYDVGGIDFAEVSDLSWALYATDPLGSVPLSGTADEAFLFEYVDANPDAARRHRYAVELFEELVGEVVPASSDWEELFSLQRLVTSTLSTEWSADQYRDESTTPASALVFEGVFEVSVPDPAVLSTWGIEGFRFVDAVTQVEEVLDAPV